MNLKDIEGFPGYRIGDNGSVWSCWVQLHPKGVGVGRVGCVVTMSSKWHRLSVRPGRQNYLTVSLKRDGKSYRRTIHTLLLAAFVGPRPPKAQGRHLNDDRNDNRVENLAWGTVVDNSEDKRRNGRLAIGERCGMAKLTESMVLEAKSRLGSGETLTAVAKCLGVERGTVRAIRDGKTWRHVA